MDFLPFGRRKPSSPICAYNGVEERTGARSSGSPNVVMQVSVRTVAIILGTSIAAVGAAFLFGRYEGRTRESRLNLARYRWKKRVLLVFAPNEEDRRFQAQMAQIASQAGGVKERGLIVLPILSDGSGIARRRDAKMLGRLYNPGSKRFCTVLLGKDGTVKLSESKPVPIGSLFDLIDSMPMRQQEMRSEHSKARSSASR